MDKEWIKFTHALQSRNPLIPVPIMHYFTHNMKKTPPISPFFFTNFIFLLCINTIYYCNWKSLKILRLCDFAVKFSSNSARDKVGIKGDKEWTKMLSPNFLNFNIQSGLYVEPDTNIFLYPQARSQ
jgi:hypothetical protein